MAMSRIRLDKQSHKWVCGDCGWIIDDQETPWRATCQACVDAAAVAQKRTIRVGDLVERALSSVGITKERFAQWTGAKSCGCAKRQQLLNQIGDDVQLRLHSAIRRAARHYLP